MFVALDVYMFRYCNVYCGYLKKKKRMRPVAWRDFYSLKTKNFDWDTKKLIQFF